MKPISQILNARVVAAMSQAIGDSDAQVSGIVKPTQDQKFGDYQANGVMSLAKQLKTNPRELAEKIIEHLDVADLCEPPEIAGPGFINFRLKPDWLAERLKEALADPKRLGIDPLKNPPMVVIDFSGPNIAKQMHVGHLRSTIIGDVIARVLEFYFNDSHKVIRQNHVGDWGLQMGMVVYALSHLVFDDLIATKGREAYDDLRKNSPAKLDQMVLQAGFDLDTLEKYYKKISTAAQQDPDIARQVRDTTYVLQGGNPHITFLWQTARTVTLRACVEIYCQLDVKLGLMDICGESFYADQLPLVISELSDQKLLQESDGAQCVFLDGFKTREGEPLPLIVKKSDGAYLYATTDLAGLRHRYQNLGVDQIIYVTDARQKLHFEMVFTCARQAGWIPDTVALDHVPFGSVLGEDHRPFKTRSGENIRLKALLDEAEKRALKIVEEKNPDLNQEQKIEIARVVGIGAVKYADLSSNLTSDYVFSWDKMLAMEGNTAPYMQYAYARVQSIFRKGNIDLTLLLSRSDPLCLQEDQELVLAKLLLRYGEVIETVARELRPHLLTNYLFELAQAFSGFYTECPVLRSEGQVRNTRLLLCHLTSGTIEHGLGLLGIKVIKKM
jgi:arginyl-tRNA synthetase